MMYRSCCSGSRFVIVMIGNKASKSIDGFLLESSVAGDHHSLHDRSHNCSPASGILPLSPLRLPLAELHQRFDRVHLLPRGRGMQLPGELRCLTLHSLHLKRLQQNRKHCTTNVGSKDITSRDTSLFKGKPTCHSAAAAAAAAPVMCAALHTSISIIITAHADE
jgi:hypothetical protein